MLVKMTRLGAMPTRVGTLTRDERRAEAAYLFYRSIGQLSNSLRGTEVWDAESARLPEHIFNHFAKCADVPGPKRKEFLLEISIPVRAWAQGLMTHGNYFRQYHSIRRHVSALLKQLRPTVETLRQESIVLPSATVKLEIACDFVLIKRSLGCDRSFLVDLYQQLDVLGEAVEDAIESLGVAGQVRPKGPLSSIKGYPRFNILVFGLERGAQRAGGKFTAHRKNGAKGSLIAGLDEFRSSLLRTEWTTSLAEFLPSPEDHPAAKYEHILKAARESSKSAS
jgi:hypothetical protein